VSGRVSNPKGVSDQEASRLFQSIYEDGLEALAVDFARKRIVKQGAMVTYSAVSDLRSKKETFGAENSKQL
jgi:hypothetical protein